MSTTIERSRNHLDANSADANSDSCGEVISRGWQSRSATKAMLLAAIAATALYALGDLVSGLIYDGYSWTDQVISELTATAAPSRPLMATVITVYTLLFIAFAVGGWRSAEGNKALRWAAAMLFIGSVVALPLHIFFPLHGRGVDPTFSDTMHQVLTVVWSLFIFAMVAFGVVAYRGWFRLYSIITLLVLPTFGYLAANLDADRAENLPTPAIGLFERINAYVLMTWLVTLAIILLRAKRTPKIRVPDATVFNTT